jgi:hypothetical protein
MGAFGRLVCGDLACLCTVNLYSGPISAFLVFYVQKNDDEEEETEEGLVREKRTSGAARQSTPRSLLKVCWSKL